MNFERYLSPTEHVFYVTRSHIAALIKDIAIALAGFLLLLIAPNPLTGFIALAVLIRSGWKALDWFYDRLLLTNQRIMRISGLITRKVASMPLTMMTDLTYQRPLMGRVFGYGTIRVESAGQEQALSCIKYVAQDIEFYRTVTALLHPPKKDVQPVISLEEKNDTYAEEAMALVRRGRPVAEWDPDDTNPNMIVLP